MFGCRRDLAQRKALGLNLVDGNWTVPCLPVRWSAQVTHAEAIAKWGCRDKQKACASQHHFCDFPTVHWSKIV
jgi:hypothetical protein